LPSSGSPSGRSPDARRLRLVAPLVAVVLAAGWSLRGRLLRGGSEATAVRALAGLTRAELPDLAGPGQGTVAELESVRFSDVLAALEGERALAVGAFEAEGRVEGTDLSVRLHAVGREQVGLEPCAQGFCPGPAGALPRLRGVLVVLVARQRRLAAAEPGRRVVGWQVRAEREVAEVGEDVELPGPGGPRRERHRLTLKWQGQGWAEEAP
jgi:hypothetical protein